jgi:signal transduction histidine kinase
MRLFLSVAVWMIAFLPLAPSFAEQQVSRSVLVIDEGDPVRPAYFPLNTTFRSRLNEGLAASVAVYAENLDLSRFQGPRTEAILGTYFREKYREKSIDLIVVNGPEALELVLRLRANLWSDVPVIFSNIDEATAARLTLPSDVTGTVQRRTLADALTTARALVPQLKRIALVGDSPERQPFRRPYAQEFPAVAAELDLIDLRGLSMGDLTARVRALPPDTAIIYEGVWSGTASDNTPEAALETIAAVANCPIVVDTEVWFGFGAAGGFLAQPVLRGEMVARLAVRILNGESVANIPVSVGDVNRPVFDWRQLQRFGISEAQLPPGSEVRFRSPTLWEEYRWQMSTAFGVALFQTAMILWLLFERRRRYNAEEISHGRLQEVIHLNRTAAAGALSASFSHELNQPLGAILANTESAEILLKTNPPDLVQITEILADIRRDDQRAAEILKHLRGLLKKKSSVGLQTFDLNDVARGAISLLAREASSRGVVLEVAAVRSALPVRAQEVHLQQVVLNLALNAMDAMLSCTPGSRKITLATALTRDSEAEMSVADTGSGIPTDRLESVFDAFYTTKPQGMGLGLSIARSIIESYGGRIWVENDLCGGAVFRFTLPLAKAK